MHRRAWVGGGGEGGQSELADNYIHSLLAGHKKEKQKALSPAAVLESLRHTLVDYQNRCSNATVEVKMI